MSTLIKFFDSGLKIEAATPGLSFTPIIVILASFFVDEIPVIIWSLNAFLEFVIKVPDFDTNEDFTLTSILFSFALRSILLGGVAGAIALVIGSTGAWAVCSYIMGTEYTIMWLNAFAVVLGGIFANVFASLYFSIRAMRASTSSVLRSEY